MKLSHLLMIILFIVSLLVSIIGGYYNYDNMNELLTEEVHNHLETVVQSKADHIEAFLTEKKYGIKVIATYKELTSNKLIEIEGIDTHFYELFVLDKDGKVIATTNPGETVGTDFSQELFFLNGKKGIYVQDAFYDEEFQKKAIVISTPHANGVLVVKIGLEQLGEITTDRTGLGETGEVYIVNKEKKLLTPSRFMTNNIMVQDVKTKNAENCLKMVEMGTAEHIGHQAVTPFLDYRGENVFGTHNIIPEMQWCVLAEIDEAEVFGTPRIKFITSAIIISITIIIFTTLVGFFVGKKLEKKIKGLKK